MPKNTDKSFYKLCEYLSEMSVVLGFFLHWKCRDEGFMSAVCFCYISEVENFGQFSGRACWARYHVYDQVLKSMV